MNYSIRERIKSIIIILLLGCSLIQIGILWGDQSHGFPFNLLDRFFHKASIPVTDEMTRNELFVPYRLAVSNGDEAYWVLERESQYYNQLWDEAKNYLDNITLGMLKVDSSENVSWGDIITKKGFLIDFRYTIKPDLLAWFLENSTGSSNIPSVSKMMIVPGSGDESSGIVYINTDGTDYISYKYSGTSRKTSFDKIISDIDAKDNEYREYKSMHDAKLDIQTSNTQENGKNSNIQPDVLYISNNEKLQNYSIISCTIPQSLSIQDELEDKILENNKDRYTPGTYVRFFQFSDVNSKYKIYKNGLLEYDYLPQGGSTISTEGGAGKALWNSYDFINRINKLTNEKAEIHLSGATVNSDGSNSFYFDYFVNGMPVYVDIKADNGDTATIHAITIVADSKRVLKCRWQIRNFIINGKSVYDDRFFIIITENENPDINYRKSKINDVAVGYVVTTSENSSLEPVMVIDSGNGIKTIKMSKEKGG